MLKLVIIAAVTLAPFPALASASAWQEISPGVRARLISSDALVDGRAMAGLELDLADGTNTYWRIPGETGIPTELDFSASSGVTSPAVHWPVPLVEEKSGYLDYVYRGQVVIPIEFDAPAEGAVLTAAITLGVCSDMCVPVMTTLSLPLTYAAPDAAETIRLDQAMAEVPIPWDQSRPPFSEVAVGPAGVIHLMAPDPSIDPATLIAEVGEPALLFGTPQKSPDGSVWTLEPLGSAASRALAGLPIQLTFTTPNGPYQVTRTLNSSVPQ